MILDQVDDDQVHKLTVMFKDWQQAQGRLQMARQTLTGAEIDVLAKEARFKGAAEFVFGTTEIRFDYDEKSGKLTFRPASVPPPHGPGKRPKKGRKS